MHTPKIAASAADRPESARRKPVQTKSYFRKAMKAALRTTVAAVCAGSLAVQAIAMPFPLDQHQQGDRILTSPVEGTGQNVQQLNELLAPMGLVIMAQDPIHDWWEARGADAHDLLRALLMTNVAVAMSRIINSLTDNLSFDTTGWDLADRAVAALPAAVLQYQLLSLNAYAYHALQGFLRTPLRLPNGTVRPGWSEQPARYTAQFIMAACLIPTSFAVNWVQDRIDEVIDLTPHNSTGHGRRLQQVGQEPGRMGNLMDNYAYAASKAWIDSERRLHLPEIENCSRTRIQLPPEGTKFGVDDEIKSFARWTWGYDPSTRAYRWIKRDDIKITPGAMATLPVKIVSDGDHVWRLTKRSAYGFKIWKQPVTTTAVAAVAKRAEWTNIPGEVIDLYPGPMTVWATNSQGRVFACKQPCAGAWMDVASPPNARQVAIGPMLRRSDWTTDRMPLEVFIKDKDGRIHSRPENVGFFDNWRANGEYFVPERIRQLLRERDAYADWADSDRFNFPR